MPTTREWFFTFDFGHVDLETGNTSRQLFCAGQGDELTRRAKQNDRTLRLRMGLPVRRGTTRRSIRVPLARASSVRMKTEPPIYMLLLWM
jgi:hypothetical protein